MNKVGKFYPVSVTYIGGNLGQVAYNDIDYAYIANRPSLTNFSRKPLIEGWLGTTNDRTHMALGEFDTQEAAYAFLDRQYDGLRDDGFLDAPDGPRWPMYKLGRLSPLNTGVFKELIAGTAREVTHDITDQQISEWADNEIAEWISQGINAAPWDKAYVEALVQIRDDLIDEHGNRRKAQFG